MKMGFLFKKAKCVRRAAVAFTNIQKGQQHASHKKELSNADHDHFYGRLFEFPCLQAVRTMALD